MIKQKKLGDISERGKLNARKEAIENYVYCINNNSTVKFKFDCMEERLIEVINKTKWSDINYRNII